MSLSHSVANFIVASRIIVFFVLLVPFAHSISFKFTKFTPNTRGIRFQGDAFTSGGVLQLTKNQMDADLTHSVGRATYYKPVKIWDARTGRVSDFTTRFSFAIKSAYAPSSGDGIAFFLAPFHSEIPSNSSGGYLGLFSPDNALYPSKENKFVAVEFDTFSNSWDPSFQHIGINVNSISSYTDSPWQYLISEGSVVNVKANYNSSTMALSVEVDGTSPLSFNVDIRNVLPEWVVVGFSAATGRSTEIHNVLSWDFESILEY